MNSIPSGQAISAENGSESSRELADHLLANSNLTKLAAWITDRNIPFLITSLGMIVMLLWAGSYKWTAPGAEGIAPLVSHSPLISWQFKLFGTYKGSDLIGATEIVAVSASSAHQSSEACGEMSQMTERINAQLGEFRL